MKYKPDASFDTGLKELTGAASPFRSLFLTRFMPTGGREGLPKPRSVERRTEVEALFHRDVLGGNLIRECDAARRCAPASSAGYHARIEKLQIVFSENALAQNQKVPANADHRHRTCQGAGSSSRDLHFVNNSKQTAASPGATSRANLEPTSRVLFVRSISEQSLHKC